MVLLCFPHSGENKNGETDPLRLAVRGFCFFWVGLGNGIISQELLADYLLEGHFKS